MTLLPPPEPWPFWVQLLVGVAGLALLVASCYELMAPTSTTKEQHE